MEAGLERLLLDVTQRLQKAGDPNSPLARRPP
jgi:hypothetical protein